MVTDCLFSVSTTTLHMGVAHRTHLTSQKEIGKAPANMTFTGRYRLTACSGRQVFLRGGSSLHALLI